MDASSRPINITPMTAEEARECVNAIKGNIESLRAMLLELHRRRGWEVLGYASFRECAVAEFGQGQAYVYRLVQAAEVEENLGQISTIVENGEIPISQLASLAKLPPEQQVEGLLRAEQIAQAKGKKRNATHVAQAVKEIGQLSPDADDAVNQQSETQVSTPDAASPPPIAIDTDEICTAVIGNVPYLRSDQIVAVLRSFAQSPAAQTLDNLHELQLKQLIKDAKRLIKNAKRELNQRHYPKYLK